jgi:hypothetical protein
LSFALTLSLLLDLQNGTAIEPDFVVGDC